MSIYTFALVGTTPIGNYYAGFLSEYFGVKIGFIGCGLIILFLLVPFYMKKSNEIKIEQNVQIKLIKKKQCRILSYTAFVII